MMNLNHVPCCCWFRKPCPLEHSSDERKGSTTFSFFEPTSNNYNNHKQRTTMFAVPVVVDRRLAAMPGWIISRNVPEEKFIGLARLMSWQCVLTAVKP